MSAHNPASRREAAACPIVLFGTQGRTVEGYRPADEDLTAARAASANGVDRHVAGPHLRRVAGRDKRSRSFCIETLGSTEAKRRAVELRRAHLNKIAATMQEVQHDRHRLRPDLRGALVFHRLCLRARR
jgi:hypothetical protein